jgi:hypothetical protein
VLRRRVATARTYIDNTEAEIPVISRNNCGYIDKCSLVRLVPGGAARDRKCHGAGR